jgi:hypothetical protein
MFQKEFPLETKTADLYLELIRCILFKQVRLICSAQASPADLFQASPLSPKDIEDQRILIDDLQLTTVSELNISFEFQIILIIKRFHVYNEMSAILVPLRPGSNVELFMFQMHGEKG